MSVMTRRIAVLALSALAAASVAGGGASAEGYPDKPVTIVVPYPPGGQPDIAARLLADGLSKIYPSRFVVENRVGAAGQTGTMGVKDAVPDGYTLLVGTVASHGVNPTMFPNLPYDAVKDFRSVALLALAPNVLVVNPSVPVNSFKEFVDYVKANPDKLSYASPGAGTLNRLIMEAIKTDLGLKLPAVPYRGAGPAFNDVVAGHVAAKVTNIELAAPMVKEGKLKALAVSSGQRSPLLPDVPTYKELGYPQFTSYVWSGLFAPKDTPEAIVAELNTKAREVLKNPSTVNVMEKLGIVVEDQTPAQFKAFVEDQVKTLGDKVHATGITLNQ